MRHADILKALKTVLRARGLTYRELAAELGLSESGLKKMFTGKDLSVGRLFDICEALDVSPVELMKGAEQSRIRDVEFSAEQQRALTAEPLLLRLYWRLVAERRRPGTLATIEKLTDSQLRAALLRLERLDLLRVTATGDVRLRQAGLQRWRPGNPFVDRLERGWSGLTLDRALAGKVAGRTRHRLSFLRVTAGSRARFESQLDALMDEFARQGDRDALLSPESDLQPYAVLIAASPGGFLDDDSQELAQESPSAPRPRKNRRRD